MGLVILLHDLSVFVRIVLEPAVLTTQRFPSNRFSQYFLQNQNGRQCGAVKKIRLVSWRQRRSKRMNNSLVLLIFERRIKWKFLFNRIPTTVPLPNLMNHGTCQNWQLLQTAKRGWTQLWSSVVKVMTLVPFQPIGISPFWRKGKFSFFPKKCTVPLFLSLFSPSHTKSPVLRWPPVLSRFYPLVQRSNKNTRKQSAVNSLR